MSFERVCALSDLTIGQAALADVDGVRVALVRDEAGHVHAIADECSHGKVSLSEGDVDGCYLECWLHGSKFDLATGVPVTPPALTAVAVYPVRLDGADVMVDVAPTATEKTPTDAAVPVAVPTDVGLKGRP